MALPEQQEGVHEKVDWCHRSWQKLGVGTKSIAQTSFMSPRSNQSALKDKSLGVAYHYRCLHANLLTQHLAESVDLHLLTFLHSVCDYANRCSILPVSHQYISSPSDPPISLSAHSGDEYIWRWDPRSFVTYKSSSSPWWIATSLGLNPEER